MRSFLTSRFLVVVIVALTTGHLAGSHAGDLAASSSPSGAEEKLLLDLQLKYLQYFLDNQCGNEHPAVCGFFLDRQRNFGAPYKEGQVSSSATGMGCIAIALASKHKLISHEEAIDRIKKALQLALQLPHEEGIGPHFVNADGSTTAMDKFATVDWGWLLAGAAWSAHFLQSEELEKLSLELNGRVNWQYWTHGSESGLISHGTHKDGRRLKSSWDRNNAESLILYVLATGADKNALPATVWRKLDPTWVDVQGVKIASGDLGLFAHQWGLELFPAEQLTQLTGIDLRGEHQKAVEAELRFSREKGQDLWGLSSGDVPCQAADDPDGLSTGFKYTENSLADNNHTFNVTVSVASAGINRRAVLDNLKMVIEIEQRWSKKITGRYGPSNFKLSKNNARCPVLVVPDAVGVDVGAAMLAVENVISNNEVQKTFLELPFVQRANKRIYALTQKAE